MVSGTFASAINCMDGRTILPVDAWMKEQFQVDYVDMITEAGPDKVLSQGTTAQVQSIKERVSISVEKHNSKVIAIVGHHDCAGNPVSQEEHQRHIMQGVAVIKSWGFDVRVIGVWLNESGEVELVVS